MKISQLIAAVFAVIFAGNIITSAQTNTALPTCIDTCITINNDDSTTINIPEKRQSVGLVLSGGGAKGIAHIGVIKALEEHDIPIDFIAGTSMGAIVGGLYAIGYTPEEMVQMLLSDSFSSWSTGQIDNNLTYYFLKQPQTPAFAHLNINLNRNDSTSTQSLMAQSIISPLPMNFAFMELFAAYTAQCGGDFNKLYIPFRCVASDVINKHKIICRDGSLADAIRASMSFPAVFAPIKMNGIDVYDGGIYDNFPVDVMREEFAPDIMIGVDVHAENAPVSNSIVAQLENMIIQNNDYSLPADEGIRIHVDVSKYSLLDFGKANEIYQIGYNRAMEMMDSLQSRITTRISAPTRRLNRAVFKSATPHLRFNKVNATGGTPSQNEYLEQIFERGKNKADTFGIDKARMAYYRALTPGKLRNLMPQAKYDKSSGLFTLNLTSESKNNFSLGAGGYLTSSINSMIFVSANYSSMTFNSLTARLMGWIGQSYMAAQADARILLTNNIPSALELMAVYSRQKYYEADKLFFQDNSPAFISNYDTFARLNFAWAIGRSAKASIGIGGGQSRNEFYSNDQANFIDSTPEETKMNIGQLIGEFEFNTLDNQSYPASGTMLNVTAMQTLGNYNHITTTTNEAEPRLAKFDAEQHWFQAEASFAHYQPFGKNFSLEINANVLVSTRDLLNTYYASIVNAPAYSPFTSVQNVFNTAFHANSYAAVGIAPIWRPFQRAQVKLSGHMFMPFQRIEQDGKSTDVHYGKWFHDPQFLAQLDLVYNLPFASISGYVNYLSYPARNWSAGIAFGLYFTAEKFLR